ncbi:MAG: FAA hydrolase family protein [Rhodocyclaceae bacterium]|nr:MAG: FAA hydrolase family protein [Rhodocyclaceae bacterium]
MKLVRFGNNGMERPGVIDEQGRIRDLSGHIRDIHGATLGQSALARIRNIDLAKLQIVGDETRLGPCVGAVGKFICVGLNYADHVAEAGAEMPREPVLFMKATSAICGPNDPIVIPLGASKVDWEVELGIVIGTSAKNVSLDAAMSHVAGYCAINDVSERAFQLEGTGQWVKGKSADTFGPIGPWLVTTDEITDVHNQALLLTVNGETRQDSNTRQMIFNVPTLVSYISRFMTLLPGDIISTGTPPGVGMGRKPPQYLNVGDQVILTISGLGQQCHEVLATH